MKTRNKPWRNVFPRGTLQVGRFSGRWCLRIIEAGDASKPMGIFKQDGEPLYRLALKRERESRIAEKQDTVEEAS